MLENSLNDTMEVYAKVEVKTEAMETDLYNALYTFTNKCLLTKKRNSYRLSLNRHLDRQEVACDCTYFLMCILEKIVAVPADGRIPFISTCMDRYLTTYLKNANKHRPVDFPQYVVVDSSFDVLDEYVQKEEALGVFYAMIDGSYLTSNESIAFLAIAFMGLKPKMLESLFSRYSTNVVSAYVLCKSAEMLEVENLLYERIVYDYHSHDAQTLSKLANRAKNKLSKNYLDK